MRIIAVDDHADSITVLKRLLASRGHEVRTAVTLAEARQLCEAEPFDLLLCDIGLPDGDGWELAAVARRSGAKSIALTGHGMPGDVDRIAGSGFAAHLLKPVTFETIESAIDAVCA